MYSTVHTVHTNHPIPNRFGSNGNYPVPLLFKPSSIFAAAANTEPCRFFPSSSPPPPPSPSPLKVNRLSPSPLILSSCKRELGRRTPAEGDGDVPNAAEDNFRDNNCSRCVDTGETGDRGSRGVGEAERGGDCNVLLGDFICGGDASAS
jgi:hypothetical protein